MEAILNKDTNPARHQAGHHLVLRHHNILVTVTCNREHIRVHLSTVNHLTQVTLNKLQLDTLLPGINPLCHHPSRVSMIITVSNSHRPQTVVEAQPHRQTPQGTVTTSMGLVMAKLVRDTSKVGTELIMLRNNRNMAKLAMTSNRVVMAAPLTRVKRKIHLRALHNRRLSLDKLGMEQLVNSLLLKVVLVKQGMELLQLLRVVTAASLQRLTVLDMEHHHLLENHRLMLRASSLLALLGAMVVSLGMRNQLGQVMDSLQHMGMVKHLRGMGHMEDTHKLLLVVVTLLMGLVELLLVVVVVVHRPPRVLHQLDRLRHPRRVDNFYGKVSAVIKIQASMLFICFPHDIF